MQARSVNLCIFLVSLVATLASLYLEFFLGEIPCDLCLLQRSQHVFSCGFAGLAWMIPRLERLAWMNAIAFGFGATVASYHGLIVFGLVHRRCQAQVDTTSMEHFFDSLSTQGACDMAYPIMGVPLPLWNLLICASCLKALRYKKH